MTCAFNSLLVLLTAFDLFFLPGYGLARRFFKTNDCAELISISLALGFLGGSVFYFAIGAFLHLWLTLPMLLCAANVVNVLHVRILLRDASHLIRHGTLGDEFVPRPGRQSRILLLAALVVFCAYFLRYDKESLAFHCMHYPVAYATGIPMGDGTASNPERNDVLALEMEQRLGNPALGAAMPGAFHFLGYRMFYASQRLLIFLFAFLIGETYMTRFRTGRQFRYGILLGALMVFHPTLAHLGELDQNMNVLVVTVVMLYLLFRDDPSCFWTGFFFGVAFGCRHIALPGVLGLVYFTLTRPRRVRSTLALATGFALPGILWSLHHVLAFGKLFYHESQRHFAHSFPHEFLGIDFTLPVLFQWPLVPELVRCPFNAFPQILLFPLTMIREQGTLLCALFVVGVVWMSARRTKDLVFILLYTLPIFCVLAVQGNWVETDKVRMTLNLFGPVVFCIWVGMVTVARSGRGRWIGGVVVFGLLASFGLKGLEDLRIKTDTREYTAHPQMPHESEDEYAIVRQEFTGWMVLPYRFLGLGLFGIEVIGGAGGAIYDLCHSRYEDQRETMPQKLAAYLEPRLHARKFKTGVQWREDGPLSMEGRTGILLRVDLSRPPIDSCSFVERVDSAPASRIEMATRTTPEFLMNKSVPFQDRVTDILLTREAGERGDSVLIVVMDREAGYYNDPPTPLPGDDLYLEVPSGARLLVLHVRASKPLLILGWDMEIRGGDRTVRGECPTVEKW